MNLVIEEKHFPLWLVPQTQVSDEWLQHLRDANKTFQIDREQSGELYIKPIAVPHVK
jgi:cell division inhibitor SulA